MWRFASNNTCAHKMYSSFLFLDQFSSIRKFKSSHTCHGSLSCNLSVYWGSIGRVEQNLAMLQINEQTSSSGFLLVESCAIITKPSPYLSTRALSDMWGVNLRLLQRQSSILVLQSHFEHPGDVLMSRFLILFLCEFIGPAYKHLQPQMQIADSNGPRDILLKVNESTQFQNCWRKKCNLHWAWTSSVGSSEM